MAIETLYPHVPKRREPLFPHVPKGRQSTEELPQTLPQTGAQGDRDEIELTEEDIVWMARASADEIRLRFGLPEAGEYPEAEIGTCYEDALLFIIKEKEGYLVHGTVLSNGKRIGHAWVETLAGYIWEPETKKFYNRKLFQAFTKAIEEQRYTPEQAFALARRTYHSGPWTEEERRRR